jgi:metallo-beta-lactamase class B
MEDYGRVPGNGLLIVDGKCGVLVDLPWTNDQTALLFDWAKKELGVNIESVIPTHSHSDCIGGLAEAHSRGAKSYAYEKTASFAKEKNEPIPQITFKKNMELKCRSIKLILDYQGGGHTLDNIIVWLPTRKILFGGCMVKSVNSKTLGYTKEADLKNWPLTLKKVKEKYSQAQLVIPGHGTPGGLELLDHTLELLKTHGY